jgi:DNA modification methylase
MSKDYKWKHEPIIYGWKGTHEWYGPNTEDSVWTIDRPSRSEEHPTMKPIALVARAIKNSSKGNQNVLDIFGGSGSTLIACEQTNRTCYMMELDPKYCDVIRKRFAKFIGKEENWQEITSVVSK